MTEPNVVASIISVQQHLQALRQERASYRCTDDDVRRMYKQPGNATSVVPLSHLITWHTDNGRHAFAGVLSKSFAAALAAGEFDGTGIEFVLAGERHAFGDERHLTASAFFVERYKPKGKSKEDKDAQAKDEQLAREFYANNALLPLGRLVDWSDRFFEREMNSPIYGPRAFDPIPQHWRDVLRTEERAETAQDSASVRSHSQASREKAKWEKEATPLLNKYLETRSLDDPYEFEDGRREKPQRSNAVAFFVALGASSPKAQDWARKLLHGSTARSRGRTREKK